MLLGLALPMLAILIAKRTFLAEQRTIEKMDD
jgi:hypothetical protein